MLLPIQRKEKPGVRVSILFWKLKMEHALRHCSSKNMFITEPGTKLQSLNTAFLMTRGSGWDTAGLIFFVSVFSYSM